MDLIHLMPPITELNMSNIVVFDLDGTLLSTDSTKVWLIQRLKSNIFRFFTAILIAPITLFLMQFKKSKGIGTSVFLWIATFGLSEQQLNESFKTFALNIKANRLYNLYWFKKGLCELNAHLTQDRYVIIATAAPEMLASTLINSINLDIKIVGTPLKKRFGGWIGGAHCRHNEKIKRLKDIGIQSPWFAAYSDDIEEDYPILINSRHPYLINGKNTNIINKQLKHIIHLNW